MKYVSSQGLQFDYMLPKKITKENKTSSKSRVQAGTWRARAELTNHLSPQTGDVDDSPRETKLASSYPGYHHGHTEAPVPVSEFDARGAIMRTENIPLT